MTTTVEHLRSLVGFATESRTSNLDLLGHVAEHVESFGGRTSFVEGHADRSSLLVSFGPDQPGGLMLAAHTDVVPAGTGWATPPYELTIRDDRAYGRGTADMKGFLAATLHVLEHLDHRSLQQPLHLALSFDEEVGCAGMPSLLSRVATAPHFRPALIVVGEPTMLVPRHRHLGKLAYDVTLRGRAEHSSRSPNAPSTITSAARITMALDSLQAAHAPDGGTSHNITVNVGTMHGGTALNVIADQCTMTFEIRHAPELAPDSVLLPVLHVAEREHQRLAEIGGGIEMTEITRYPGLNTATSDPLVRLVERIADAGPCQAIGYGTEGGLYAQALGVPVVICGPGDIGVAHRADEYVELSQLYRCELFVAQLIDQICRA